jgi:hypothetical protein
MRKITVLFKIMRFKRSGKYYDEDYRSWEVSIVESPGVPYVVYTADVCELARAQLNDPEFYYVIEAEQSVPVLHYGTNQN